MYDSSDPRSSLTSPSAALPVAPDNLCAADFARFYAEPPQDADALSHHWYIRGQNFVLCYSKVEAGAVLARGEQADEYVILIPDPETTIEVTARGEDGSVAVTQAAGPAVVMVPPGPSSVGVVTGGEIVRLFSQRAIDLADRAVNRASYAAQRGAVKPMEPWPEPPGGWRVRVYNADVPEVPGRLGRIWRCTTFMINWFPPKSGPRDPSKLSPHHHDDFEQCSLTLEGDWVQHLRWPWTVDLSTWRGDEHAVCASPSVTIIPAGVTHTSQSVGTGLNTIVDIFCPPRLDFSQLGWVLNAQDYPLPVGAA